MADFDFTGYMRQIAIKLKEIQHVENDDTKTRFYRIASLEKLDEVIQRITELGKINILVEDNDEGGLVQSDSLHDRKICSFFVIEKAEVNDASDRERVKKACKAVERKILSKAYNDYLTDMKNPINNQIGLRNADFNTWQYNTFGPLLNCYYGIHVAFSVTNSIKVNFNPDDWLE